MASQSQQISTSTVILATAGTLAAGAIAYAAYFDYRRRSDPEFRKSLKKQHKKVQKAKEEEGKAAEQGQKERIKQAVIEANEDGFPRDPEETEGYFSAERADHHLRQDCAQGMFENDCNRTHSQFTDTFLPSPSLTSSPR